MSDFISMVGKKDANILAEDAAAMIADATRIMSAMGCSAPLQPSMSQISFMSRLTGVVLPQM